MGSVDANSRHSVDDTECPGQGEALGPQGGIVEDVSAYIKCGRCQCSLKHTDYLEYAILCALVSWQDSYWSWQFCQKPSLYSRGQFIISTTWGDNCIEKSFQASNNEKDWPSDGPDGFHTSEFPYQGCEAVLLSLDGNLHQNLLVQAAPETKLPLKCHVRGSFLYLNQRERQWARWKGAWKQQTQRKRQCLLVMRLWPSPDVPLTCLGCDQAAKQWEKKIPTFSQGGLLENLLTNRVRSISTAILKPPSHHSNVVFKIVSLLGYCLGGLTVETWALSPLQKPHNVPQVLWIELCTPCQIHTSIP